LDVAAQIVNGSTMLPIRPVLESVGYNLAWNGFTQQVLRTRNGVEKVRADETGIHILARVLLNFRLIPST